MAIGDPGPPLEEAIRICESWYEQRKQPPAFKISPASNPELVGLLDKRGYNDSKKGAIVMRQRLSLELVETAAQALTPEWLDAYIAGSGTSNAFIPILTRLLEKIESPHSFATKKVSGIVASCGLGVIADKTLWFFDVATRPEFRRQGLAKVMIADLIAWGSANGAVEAALQVQVDNTAAIALYEGLCFRPIYEYQYRFLAVK